MLIVLRSLLFNKFLQVVQESRRYVVHPDWSPALAANDLALVYLEKELSPTRNDEGIE